MINVGTKKVTRRTAVAEARIRISPETMRAVREGKLAKGELGPIVKIAGIQAAKKTSELIPLCHTLALDHISVEIEFQKECVIIKTRAETTSRTGVEIEAMTAAAISALSFYDMIKGIERGAVIESVRLLEKQGGRSGVYKA